MITPQQALHVRLSTAADDLHAYGGTLQSDHLGRIVAVLREAADALSPRPEASAWQDMSSAPRDGTPVDLWNRAGFRECDVWWDGDDQCWTSCNPDSAYSHWMALPDPPSPPSKDER